MSKSGHAVVIGGSIAGMLAARVLSNHFEQVTIVERDELPQGKQNRSGVPQGRHVHTLMIRGLNIIESMLPGFSEDLRAEGALSMNWGKELKCQLFGNWLAPIESDVESVVASRGLFEWVIRRRVMAMDCVKVIEQCQVAELLTTEDHSQVTGVRLVSKLDKKRSQLMAADFVVDASGRGSKAMSWLEELGYGRPEETSVDAKVGYATRLYRKPESLGDQRWTMFIPAQAPKTRGGTITEIEEGVLIVSVLGMAGDYPPTDNEQWLEFVKTLPAPEYYETIKNAEPLTDVVGFRRTQNFRRHFEKLKRFPGHFVVLGDAACAFNPVYGHGMSSAAIGVELLDECLSDKVSLEKIGKVFQKRLTKVTTPLWIMATGNDLLFETTEGQQPVWIVRKLQKYLDLYLSSMSNDPVLIELFYKVQNLLEPSTALMRPSIIVRVVKNALSGRSSRLNEEGSGAATVTQQ